MSDLYAFNRETPADRQERKERAALVNSGIRGRDGLTANERDLLERLRRLGDELTATAPFARTGRKAA